MPKLPRVSGKKLSKVLTELGFRQFRKRGSHVFFVHNDGRVTTVAIHGNKEIPIGTLKSIIRQSGLDEKEFR